MEKPTTTAAQLRKNIVAGLTGEKIPYEDPVAAPMGIDDEAAGTPLSAQAADLATFTEPQGETSLDAPAVTEERFRPSLSLSAPKDVRTALAVLVGSCRRNAASSPGVVLAPEAGTPSSALAAHAPYVASGKLVCARFFDNSRRRINWC